MLAGTELGIDRQKIVVTAGFDLDLSLRVKRDRTRAGQGKGFNVFGRIETIYIEPDRDCRLDPAGERKTGRRLYWPQDGPLIAKTIPEEDLIFAQPLRLISGRVAMPMVPDPEDVQVNPYKVDKFGVSHLAPGEKPVEPRKKPQLLEKIASAKFKNFLVFHPVSQIIFFMGNGSTARWGTVGDARMPLSSLTGFDGRKMALLIDPYTGEAFFSGGRYDFLQNVVIPNL
jgi:hypothetical protein